MPRMNNFSQKHSFEYYPWYLCLFGIFVFQAPVKCTADEAAGKTPVSAVFIFGDSTVDPGNNNFITTPFKSNFLPYGKDFLNHIPTGRFSNGLLTTDFIAKYVGVKDAVPPYLDSSLSTEELKTGVSFASAGTGFDPLTPKISNVISLQNQLENFKEYKAKMEEKIGKGETEGIVKNALFVVSAGTNDFVVNYNTLPIRRRTYTLPEYIHFVQQHLQEFLQGLWDEGGRRIGVVGLPPMGCLPVVITLHSNNAFTERGCIDLFSATARDYNSQLQGLLAAMQLKLAAQGARIAYQDIYAPLMDMMTQGNKYGFEEFSSGCCGTGMLEASFMCNPKSYVCRDPSKYVFWDAIHPTEKTGYLLSQALRPTIDSIISS
nr:GDSL esterase/lipase At5g45960-like [Ipomoea batatas]